MQILYQITKYYYSNRSIKWRSATCIGFFCVYLLQPQNHKRLNSCTGESKGSPVLNSYMSYMYVHLCSQLSTPSHFQIIEALSKNPEEIWCVILCFLLSMKRKQVAFACVYITESPRKISYDKNLLVTFISEIWILFFFY